MGCMRDSPTCIGRFDGMYEGQGRLIEAGLMGCMRATPSLAGQV